MRDKTSFNRFVSKCFAFGTLSTVLITFSLLVYFLLPTTKEEQKVIPETILEIIPEPEEPEISAAFQEYLADVSFDKLNNDVDTGLDLYREPTSRAAVEWFYTHITGNMDVAHAILSEAEKNDIPLSLAFSLAYTESRYNVNAIHQNANNTTDRGLFQLNSNTFPELTEADFYDPFVSSKYGISHLKFCLNTAGNEVTALAMYNAGTNRVRSNKTPQTTLNYVGSILNYQKMLDDLFEQEVASFYEAPFTKGYSLAYANGNKQ